MEYIYAALLLHKLEKEVTEDSVKTVIAATGATVDNDKVKSLVASLNGVDIEAELSKANFVQAPAQANAPAAQAPKEEAPKEEKHEAAAEGLASLFG